MTKLPSVLLGGEWFNFCYHSFNKGELFLWIDSLLIESCRWKSQMTNIVIPYSSVTAQSVLMYFSNLVYCDTLCHFLLFRMHISNKNAMKKTQMEVKKLWQCTIVPGKFKIGSSLMSKHSFRFGVVDKVLQ